MNISTLLPMLPLEEKEKEKTNSENFTVMKVMPILFFAFIFPLYIHSPVHYCCIVI